MGSSWRAPSSHSRPSAGLPSGDVVRYYRAFRMPEVIDPNGISADLKQSVLHVHVKKSEAAKPRVIPIRSS